MKMIKGMVFLGGALLGFVLVDFSSSWLQMAAGGVLLGLAALLLFSDHEL